MQQQPKTKGATTPSIMTLGRKTFSIISLFYSHTKCHPLIIVMLTIIMLNIVLRCCIIKLSEFMLSVIMPSVIKLSVIMLPKC